MNFFSNDKIKLLLFFLSMQQLATLIYDSPLLYNLYYFESGTKSIFIFKFYFLKKESSCNLAKFMFKFYLYFLNVFRNKIQQHMLIF